MSTAENAQADAESDLGNIRTLRPGLGNRPRLLYHKERAHQGLGSVAPAPEDTGAPDGPVRCRERLGGLLKHYYRAAG